MAIIEKKLELTFENGALPESDAVENAIKQAGLEPVRWAIVDIKGNKFTILVNGIQNP